MSVWPKGSNYGVPFEYILCFDRGLHQSSVLPGVFLVSAYQYEYTIRGGFLRIFWRNFRNVEKRRINMVEIFTSKW